MELAAKQLRNKLIMLIQADGILAGYVGDIVRGDGAQVLGPARTIDEATALIGHLRELPHAAVVCADIFEADGTVLHESLQRLCIPVLLTLRKPRALLPFSSNYDILIAPFAASQVVDRLSKALSQADDESCL